VKILSWNVNGIRACAKKGLMSFLQKHKVDVAGFQELKAFQEQCPELYGKHLGFQEDWHSAEKPGYSGVGLFWKDKAAKIKQGLGDAAVDREGRVQRLDIGDAVLVNAYVPNGAASDERHNFKMNFLKNFLDWLKKEDKKKPVILFGDINIAHRAIDIHDPVRLDGTSGFRPEEREWMDQLFDAGFVDAFRSVRPDEAERYSWWSYRAGARQRNKGWRIDYFILSRRLEKRIKKIEMMADRLGSDHCPLLLEI